MKSLIFFIGITILLSLKAESSGVSLVYKECSTRPWQSDVRELWTRTDGYKLLFEQVKRVALHYEHPWSKEFEEYEAFGDDGWYYIGCTGDEQLFYTPVNWEVVEGCSKKISYTDPENRTFYADIIRAKKDSSCKEDEVTKYWYDDKWHDIPEENSMVYQECSTRPWKSDVRELWTRTDGYKLLFEQVKRVGSHYEHPWANEFEEYEAFGDNGWYYVGCTGEEQIFYTPKLWNEKVGCFKQISYTDAENRIFYADIIRAKKDGSCKEDEVTKYWYDDKWNVKERLLPTIQNEIEQPTLNEESESTTVSTTTTTATTTITTTTTETTTPTSTSNTDDDINFDADSFGTSTINRSGISFCFYLTLALCLLLIF